MNSPSDGRYLAVVITGLSGSGRSSLAWETLCAEGQRRYVEMMDKPDAEHQGIQFMTYVMAFRHWHRSVCMGIVQIHPISWRF